MWHIRFVASGMLIAVFVFVFGLIIGSFLNVCIVRIPGGKSIVLPASACVKCGAPIRPYDNIPVVSYLLLRGKCRKCKNPISAMYPVVEFLTGLLFLGCYVGFWSYGGSAEMGDFFGDHDRAGVHRFAREDFPDAVNFTGLGLGLLLSFFTAASRRNSSGPYEADVRVSSAGAGAFICGRAVGRGGRQRSAVAGVGGRIFVCAGARGWAWAT